MKARFGLRVAALFYSALLLPQTMMATSDALELRLARGPYLQIGAPDSVVVRWRTDGPSDSVVHYGTEQTNLHLVATSLLLTNEHIVSLDGLEPNTKYFYSVGSTLTNLAGGEDYYFITAPASPKPTRIWAIGDCGTASAGHPGSQMVRDAYYGFAGTNETDVWLMLGDNVYYSGTDGEYQVAVFETFHELLRRTVVWSTIGNHETYGPRPNGRFAYLDIFSLPMNGEAGGVPSGTEHYYSFDYSNIHFVCLDSEESDRGTNGPMLTWLEEDLAANTNEWLIVFWHSPPYSKGSHDSDNVFDSAGRLFDMRTNVVPIVEAHGADLVLCGHSHSYERSYLLNGHYGTSTTLASSMIRDAGSGRESDTGPYLKPGSGPAAHEGTIYIVAGSSGWATFLTGQHPAMFTTLLQLGSLVIDINGSRLDAKFLRETGAVDDYFTIIKGSAPAPFRVTTLRFHEGQSVVRWKSMAGRSYWVEEAIDIESPAWKAVSPDVTATGATTSWTNASPANAKSFYRVVEWTED